MTSLEGGFVSKDSQFNGEESSGTTRFEVRGDLGDGCFAAEGTRACV